PDFIAILPILSAASLSSFASLAFAVSSSESASARRSESVFLANLSTPLWCHFGFTPLNVIAF
ncbi:hypothetical protein, partial [Pseudomonas aeruginosa]|uniref:hypothetical protein n=1 Tax=Pseudomonas aeruginosa TaxID=287 RepID=UPI003D7678A5